MDFYKGNVLRIDLSAGTTAVEPLNMEWAEQYIGGKGLLLRYMWQEVPAKVDPWAPENPIILMTGPFAGTGVTTASRLVVGCKSPTTGIYTDSYVGGSFAPELKFAGYDAVIITGKAAKPTVVVVKDDVVEFRPADKYVGMKTSEVEEAMRKDVDPDAKTLSIGPAGEAKIPWACISTDQYHKAGRGGHGALMGDKNLKAVVVRGTGAVPVGDAKAFLGLIYKMHEEYILTEDNLWAHEEGTPVLVDPVNGAGAFPTRNWSAGEFEGAEKINSEAFQKIRTKKRACYQCAIGCRNFHATTFAGETVRGEGPEYETIALCGANCGIDDIDALMKFNELCDELGLDTISSGSVVGLAMDMTEKGIKDFGLRFGEVEGYIKAPTLIAQREGIGAELALGARALAAKYGHPELAMEVKGLELPGYDPRGSFGMSVGYATSDRGGCHMRTYPTGDEVVGGTSPANEIDAAKIEQIVVGDSSKGFIGQNMSSIKFSAILCDFWAVTPEQLAILFKELWGRDFTEDEVLKIGERVWNLGRLFNLREGVEKDDLPKRLYAESGAFAEGPSAGQAVGEDKFNAMMAEYYTQRGWDASGVPSEAKLTELGIDVRL
ncbi:MAG TPA: aldehyde ferredoxin oxidoreductase family protein [Thermoleophilia bacterium]|nr:aldehyde ferredoxin oxidoreductase family protein [Thermoleophilia bacterium]